MRFFFKVTKHREGTRGLRALRDLQGGASDHQCRRGAPRCDRSVRRREPSCRAHRFTSTPPRPHAHVQYNSYQQQPQAQPASPASASPFAFAPPPLARPTVQMHHSEPAPGAYPYNSYSRPPVPSSNSYAYGSAPMGYRSYSTDSGTGPSATPVNRGSPQPQTMTRPSLNIVPPAGSMHAQQSPSASPYPYQRQVSGNSQPYSQAPSPQRAPVYPSQYYLPQSAEMPRSMSYPSYAQPYPSPQYHMSGPMHHPPGLARHNTTQGMEAGNMELGMRPSMGYSFANRLPLTDRPFKCDECVQSFNRNHDLKRHKRIHLAVKPFGCDKCGKTFSRKDALRRHWLVKGCRGEDGATAPIVPMFPINLSRPPALSPPTPPHHISPDESESSSMKTYSAPAPLHTLPHRHSSMNESQMIVTPDELAAQNGMRTEPMIASLDEPLNIEPSMNSAHRGSTSSMHGDGYFEGVVGLKQDGTALVESTPGNNSPFSKYPHSPQSAPAYRREAVGSPQRTHSSPTAVYMQPSRSYSPSGLGQDGKPVFAIPFAPNGYHHHDNGMLGPPDSKMERQGSQDGADQATWQRWHRPSFPFPPPPGSNYNQYETSSPVEAVTAGAGRQAYAQ